MKSTPHDPHTYDELLREFKIALSRVLSGSILPPGAVILNGPLTAALADVAEAARSGEPTNYWVSRACFEFSKMSSARELIETPSPPRHLKAVS